MEHNEIESIFNACYDGIYVCNNELVGIWVNQAFERITGIPIQIWKTYDVYQLIKDDFIQSSVSARVKEQKQQVTMLQNYKTGKTALVTGLPILKDGLIDKIVVTARDITDINRLSEELERSKMRSEQYQKELSALKAKEDVKDHIICNNPEMKNLIDLAIRVSHFDSSVLILGESGVGKEVMAHLIHESSPRKSEPFIEVNCGAIPRDLLESELFGYAAGAFTGARKEGKPGLFELADKGTIFLDEVGELPLDLQVKLLRFLQDFRVNRVGGTKAIQLDVRIIAATNRILEEMVSNGKFREDLYYRLSIIPILIPPLRNRREDIAAFCMHFLDYYNKKYQSDKFFHHSVIELLEDYDWPGNVRELQHLVERLMVTTEEQCIRIENLPQKVRTVPIEHKELATLQEIVEKVEKEMLLQALSNHQSATQAAKILGLSQPTMSRKMKKYEIDVPNE